eukprot:TRINITY_DN3993_c0_g1_i1.p1 TRINITY_DN3993_c0_g1~~TRINITY_DN3993_c0_g1_i1.p1  ORF type:complete len:1091 (+),score=399.48 TRINITY_DN3993_c0_g1_i1:732-4004(+)
MHNDVKTTPQVFFDSRSPFFLHFGFLEVFSFFLFKFQFRKLVADSPPPFSLSLSLSLSLRPKPRVSAEIVTTFKEESARVSDQIERKKAGKEVAEDKKAELTELDEHTVAIDELYERFNTKPDFGLTSAVAAERLEIEGPNMLTPPATTPEWIKFVQQLTTNFALLLWVGSILSFVGYGLDQTVPENLYIGIVLAVVVMVTGIFSYFQERNASEIMEKFKHMLPDSAVVIRDGEQQSLDATQLVRGDIVKIKAGDKIVADVRIMESDGLKVDNSSLTGESEPQSRSSECTDDNPYETKNLAFYSTLATKGTATGIVVYTGDDTIIGRIANLAAGTEGEETPIHREIEHFIKIVSSVALFLGVTFFIIGLALQTSSIIQNLVFMIGIIVANVPEGLLATVTVSLTLTANRMAEKQVLVKNLESVETLGSTTTICSDKTGTLTQNKMTLSHLWYDCKIEDCESPTTTATYDVENVTFKRLLRIAALCNNAVFDSKDTETDIKKKNVIGDASETALLRFTQSKRDVKEWRLACKKVFEIPFNSTNKFQVSVHKPEASDPEDTLFMVMKGAPERIFDRCTKIMVNSGEIVDKTDEHQAAYDEAYTDLGARGERVLGFCQKVLSADYNDYEFDEDNAPLDDLVFVGLMSLIDPPRPAVPKAVHDCQTAGIRVIMVTGDHPLTAQAIAKEVGIINKKEGRTRFDVAKDRGVPEEEIPYSDPEINAAVVHGKFIPNLDTDEKWDEILDKKYVVFARTSPEQKLIIVKNNQRRKCIVAVTGDGVNDSPALKKADIGVAMGIAGSDVSKEAADMILLDDNFASIVEGVKEGRLIFDNLKKSIAYTLSSNIPEIAPFLVFITVALPLPLPTVLILCVDLGTDMVPAISLAYETPESTIMQRPPRNAEVDKLVTSRLISFSYLQIGIQQALAGFYTYMVVLGDYGFPPFLLPGAAPYWDNPAVLVSGINSYSRDDFLKAAQTAYFVSIVVVQWADLMICKTRILSIFQQGMRNKNLNFGLFSETLLAAILCYVPFINQIFLTRPIDFVHWLPGIPFSIVIFCYDETRKYLIRKDRDKNSYIDDAGVKIDGPPGWLEQKTYY